MPSPRPHRDADIPAPAPDPVAPEALALERAERAAVAASGRRLRVPTFGLSATQLVATGLAAITATVAASFLGVTGTVIGAALASVTTAVGNAVYGQSLRRTGDRVRGVVPVLAARPTPLQTAPSQASPSSATQSQATASVGRPRPTRRDPDEPPALPAGRPLPTVVWKRVAFGAVSVFVVVLAVVTGVEVVAGRPIADVVRGDSGSGTSFFGNAQVRTETVTPAAPTTTVTVTPKVVVTTPTITQTAPAATRTATSGTVTTTPTSTPTTSTDGSASASSSTSPAG